MTNSWFCSSVDFFSLSWKYLQYQFVKWPSGHRVEWIFIIIKKEKQMLTCGVLRVGVLIPTD